MNCAHSARQDTSAPAAGLERAERELPETIETRLEWAIVIAER